MSLVDLGGVFLTSRCFAVSKAEKPDKAMNVAVDWGTVKVFLQQWKSWHAIRKVCFQSISFELRLVLFTVKTSTVAEGACWIIFCWWCGATSEPRRLKEETSRITRFSYHPDNSRSTPPSFNPLHVRCGVVLDLWSVQNILWWVDVQTSCCLSDSFLGGIDDTILNGFLGLIVSSYGNAMMRPSIIAIAAILQKSSIVVSWLMQMSALWMLRLRRSQQGIPSTLAYTAPATCDLIMPCDGKWKLKKKSRKKSQDPGYWHLYGIGTHTVLRMVLRIITPADAAVCSVLHVRQFVAEANLRHYGKVLAEVAHTSSGNPHSTPRLYGTYSFAYHQAHIDVRSKGLPSSD